MIAFPFRLEPDRAEALYLQTLGDTPARLRVRARPHWEAKGRLPRSSLPLGVIHPDRIPPPVIRFGLYDAALYVMPAAFVSPAAPPDARGNRSLLNTNARAAQLPTTDWDNVVPILIDQEGSQRLIEQMSNPGGAFVGLWGASANYLYGANADTLRLELVDPAGNVLDTIEPAVEGDPRDDILFRTNLGPARVRPDRAGGRSPRRPSASSPTATAATSPPFATAMMPAASASNSRWWSSGSAVCSTKATRRAWRRRS